MNRISDFFQHNLPSPRRVALAYAIIVFGLFLYGWLHADSLISERFRMLERQKVESQIWILGTNLTHSVSQNLSLVSSLRAFIEAQEEDVDFGGTFDQELEVFSAGLHKGDTSIRNIAVSPGGVMQFVYPYEENKSVLGYDPASDPRATVRAEVQRAVETHKIVLSLPYELVQGGLGMVSRQAIYKDNTYWGLANVVLGVPDILVEAGIEPPPEGLSLAIKDQVGQIFWGSDVTYTADPVLYTIPLPEGSWELAAIPIKGWGGDYIGILWLYRVLGMLLVVVLPVTVYLSINRRERLMVLVDQRTQELETANKLLEKQISERVEAEVAQRSSEEMLRLIFEYASDGISLYEELPESNSRRLIDCNERYIQMSGRSKPELLESPNTSHFQRSVEPLRNREENQFLRQNLSHYQGTFTWIRPDGQENVIEYTAAPIQLGTTPVTVGIDRDITERIRAEEALKKAALEWKTTFDSVSDAVCLLDNEQRITRVNQAMKDLFPNRQDDLIHKHCWEVVHGTTSPHEVCPIIRMRSSLKREIQELPLNSRIIEVTVDPILDSSGVLAGAVHVIRDISDRKQAEQQLNQYMKRLEEMVQARTRELQDTQDRLIRQERLAALGELAGGVGHELRNPLGVVSNAVYFLKILLPQADQQVREYLGHIETSTQEASRIVTDLLDFARLKSLDRSPAIVSNMVAEVLVHCPPPEDVATQVVVAEDLPPVFVDPRQIVQVLCNLATNAYQAMPQGGELRITAQQVAGMVEISVADSGIGITLENLGIIFEPLFTTKNRGVGLGLAISKRLVEANGGTLTAESDGLAGKGAIFRALLPIFENLEA